MSKLTLGDEATHGEHRSPGHKSLIFLMSNTEFHLLVILRAHDELRWHRAPWTNMVKSTFTYVHMMQLKSDNRTKRGFCWTEKIELLKRSWGFEILMRKVVVRDFSRDDIRPVWYGGYGETCLLRWLLEPSHLTPVFAKLKFKCIFDTFKIHWNFRRARDHPKYSYRLMITCQTDILVHYEWI